MENKIDEITVGDLIFLCKIHNLDPYETPVMYSEPERDILTVVTSAKINKDIIELS